MQSRRAFWIAFSACAIAATLPLLVTGPLPMADLPEHIAQVAIWKHFGDSCHRFQGLFEINLATPYLLGYLVARALALFLSAAAAIKVTVWLSIILLPLSIRMLLLRGGGDPWWSLIGFPLAYGYAFYWGFFNFSLAVPVGLVYVALLFDKRSRPVLPGLLALVLLGAHALMLVFCIAVTLGIAALRRSWRVLLPILPATLLLGAWVLNVRQAERAVHMETTWNFSGLRLLYLPSSFVANAWEPAGFVLLAGIAAAVALTRPRVARDPARWTLAAVASLIYFAAPFAAFGSVCLYPRFGGAVLIAGLFLFEASRASTLARVLVVLIVLEWMVVLSGRFHEFGADAAEFERIVERMPAGRRVILLQNDVVSEVVPGPVFSHFAALYQARKGGVVAESFANYYPQVVRYRRGAAMTAHEPYSAVGAVHWPSLLQYDYVIARAAGPRGLPFRGVPPSVVLRARRGMWWVFETPRARAPQRVCESLPGE